MNTFFGPDGWVEFMQKETSHCKLPPNLAVFCLNPDKMFRQRLLKATQIVEEGRPIVITSVLRQSELKSNLAIRSILESENVMFVQGPEKSVLVQLLHLFGPR